ncbi:ornithine aminotransferase, mitochondrial-like [Humulus lupulus]|uniref:ornithine aminotransferase, mitochondrial-like n=1 Tax=Humulus lupulus TaxID=3486 RepID=UPI002B40173D|nr:ornithine aminotransferase, mitochondrial-like [Humulus lupulus]
MGSRPISSLRAEASKTNKSQPSIGLLSDRRRRNELASVHGFSRRFDLDSPSTMNRPLLPGHLKVDFGDLVALEKAFKENGDRIAGFLFKPIQGEARVVIPHDGYLKSVRELCSKYNILMIADQIQSGLARSGKLLACDWEEVRPDVMILGKALGDGVIPVSVVLADKDVMLCIRPGEHGRFAVITVLDLYLISEKAI